MSSNPNASHVTFYFHYRGTPVFVEGQCSAMSWHTATDRPCNFYCPGRADSLAPYATVLISLPLVLMISGTLRTGFLALYTAMSEQVPLNVLSISVLGLVGDIWTGITPFMFSERAVATLGGMVFIVTLKSRLGERLETSLELLGW